MSKKKNKAFIHQSDSDLFNKYLLSTYCESWAVVDTEDSVVSGKGKAFVLHKLISEKKETNKDTQKGLGI